MRQFSFSAFLFCALLATFFAVWTAWIFWDQALVPEKNPPLIAEPSLIDFGQVGEEFLSSKALVKNRSKRPLFIESTTSNCSCSNIRIEKGDLPPGSSTPLYLTFDTHGRSGKTQTFVGVLYKTENDDETRHLIVELRADVTPIERPEENENGESVAIETSPNL